MRVVADTNTVVSAVLWGGPPAAILVAAREGRITLCSSPVRYGDKVGAFFDHICG